ncbi:MAG: hypothetical protein LBE09_03785 [Christensenellaceae bacterium]|nr:hypothetical protein [Christensenellaceae bacterium]
MNIGIINKIKLRIPVSGLLCIALNVARHIEQLPTNILPYPTIEKSCRLIPATNITSEYIKVNDTKHNMPVNGLKSSIEMRYKKLVFRLSTEHGIDNAIIIPIHAQHMQIR